MILAGKQFRQNLYKNN